MNLKYHCIFVILVVLESTVSSKTIENCLHELYGNIHYDSNTGVITVGAIDVNVESKGLGDIIDVKDMTFHGQQFDLSGRAENITMDLFDIKAVQVHRFVNYTFDDMGESVKRFCHLTYISHSPVDLFNDLKLNILKHAEYCISRYICNPKSYLAGPIHINTKINSKVYGTVDIELHHNKTDDVVLVKNIVMQTLLQQHKGVDYRQTIKTNFIRAIRVNRVLEYPNDTLLLNQSFCSLSFIENHDHPLPIKQEILEQYLTLIEYNITKVLCKFRRTEGYNINVVSRKKEPTITTQSKEEYRETINALVDQVLETLMNSFSKVNVPAIVIPPLRIKKPFSTIAELQLNTSSGHISFPNDLKRSQNFKVLSEGRRHILYTAFKFDGGNVTLTGVNISVGTFANLSGNISIDMTGGNILLKLGFDHTGEPCRILIENVKITIPAENADFTQLVVTNAVLSLLKSFKGLTDVGLNAAKKAANDIFSWFQSESSTTTEAPTSKHPVKVTADEVFFYLSYLKEYMFSQIYDQIDILVKNSLEGHQCGIFNEFQPMEKNFIIQH